MSGLQPDGTFVTGTGQTLGGLHSIERCRPQHGVIHNPSDHHMRDWPTHFRDDRHLMERMCPHGVGHPDPDDPNPNTVHGCDGCCLGPDGFERVQHASRERGI